MKDLPENVLNKNWNTKIWWLLGFFHWNRWYIAVAIIACNPMFQQMLQNILHRTDALKKSILLLWHTLVVENCLAVVSYILCWEKLHIIFKSSYVPKLAIEDAKVIFFQKMVVRLLSLKQTIDCCTKYRILPNVSAEVAEHSQSINIYCHKTNYCTCFELALLLGTETLNWGCKTYLLHLNHFGLKISPVTQELN